MTEQTTTLQLPEDAPAAGRDDSAYDNGFINGWGNGYRRGTKAGEALSKERRKVYEEISLAWAHALHNTETAAVLQTLAELDGRLFNALADLRELDQKEARMHETEPFEA